MSAQQFLDLTKEGKNTWWRYALGLLLTLLLWIMATVILTVPIVDGSVPADSSVGVALQLMSFAPMLLLPLLMTRWLHGRSAGTLLGPAKRLNWRRIGAGFIVWVALASLATLVDHLLHPGNVQLNPDFGRDLLPILIAIALVPIQTSAEEILYRGYLLQALGRLTRNRLVLSAVNGFLFTLPHLANTEAQTVGVLLAGLNWFASGFFFTLITLRSGSLDYALAVHAANNLVSFIVFGYVDSSFPVISLFISQELYPVESLVSYVVAAAIAYWLLNRRPGDVKASPGVVKTQN